MTNKGKEKSEADYVIASISIIGSYYVIFFIFAARIIFAPAAPFLRLLPMKDADALFPLFLYRWVVCITVMSCIIAATSIIFRDQGISERLFHLLYSASDLADSAIEIPSSFTSTTAIWARA